MKSRTKCAASSALVAAAFAATSAAAEPLRVVSLDQCADQYVLALAPEAAVGLSFRADDPDSHLRRLARGAPQVRASTEAVLAARPAVVVRFWGGDQRLASTLRRRGVRVAQIDESADFDGVHANVRRVAQALGRPARGEALIADMDQRLANARGAWRGRSALYLTPGAFTAGPGTLIDAVMRLAGLRNLATAPGYAPAPNERIVLSPPAAVVRGFFDQIGWTRWSPGRQPAVSRALRGRTVADLPASLLGCPAPFVGEAAERLAAGAPARP